MNISIRGDKIEITEAIKKYVSEKLDKLNKYFDNASQINAHVLIRVKNNIQSIEVTIPTNRFTLRAEEGRNDLYQAIDEVVDVLERQIRKNKTKLSKQTVVEFVYDVIEEDKEVNDSSIVKRKNIDTKPMSEEEAILQMELLGHDFFVFKNVDEECISVVYKRKDNNYGIINSR